MTRTVPALLLGAALLGACTDLTPTDPNRRTAENFWRTEADASQGINATYRVLQENGTYGRWLQFAYDLRSDIGTSNSPWGDLANFTKSVLGDYDFEVNREIWQHHYRAIFRANQVIAYVPSIDMNTATRDRIVGEARFIRGLMYFNLATLYGGVPMILTPSTATDRPAQATEAEVWAQVEADLTAARTMLPAAYSGADVGRATSGAATALLARAHLQQGEWGPAAQLFATVTGSGQYSLLGNYADNFTESGDNNRETIFEVQFGGPEVLAAGSRGQNVIKMIGPCDVGFCDGEATPWYLQQLQAETTTGGNPDPRLLATLFYNRPGMDVYGVSFQQRYSGNNLNRAYWKKFGEYYKSQQDWDNPINMKVMRLGGVLLLQADALNEGGSPSQAMGLVNQVRARAGMPALSTALTQGQARDRIEAEILKEMGLEHERFFWLKRHGWLTDAGRIATLRAHDPDFALFDAHRALLPIPTTEINLNPNVQQNAGW